MSNITTVQPISGIGAMTSARLRLAAAVLKPGERVAFLTADNRRAEYTELRRAVTAGRAYMGQVDDDVLAVDCDPSDRPETALDLQPVLDALRGRGIEPVVTASGRPGHQHLFARVPDADLRCALADLATRTGLGVRSVIRLPLSPHRLGHEVRLLEPPTVDRAVAALTPRRPRPLSPVMHTVLITGVSTHFSPSERLQGLCTAMVQADWSFEESFDELWAHPGGATLQRVHAEGRDPRQYLRGCWAKAADYIARSPAWEGPHELVADLLAMRERAQDHDWSGVRGSTQRMVLTALIDIAVRIGQVEVHASERQLLELTSRSTRRPIRDALRALAQDGWLRRRSVGSEGKASTYQLNIHHRVKKTPSATSRAAGGA